MSNLEWSTEKRVVNELLPLKINPRKITEARRMKMIESIQKFNLVDIPVIDFDGTIISGHQRLRALQAIGRGDEMIDIRFPNRKLTVKECKEYNLLANSHFGEFDFDLLDDFDDIDFDLIPIDLQKIEFEESDMFDKQMNNFFKRKEASELKAEDDGFEDEQQENKPETDIVYGDVFLIGEHRLMCGSAAKREDVVTLMNNHLADMIFTDPPYDLEDCYSANIFESAGENCHIFIMTSEKILMQVINNGFNYFRKLFAVDFRLARLVSNNQPMTRVDFIAEFNKGKNKFVNTGDGFTTLIESAKIHNVNEKINFGHNQAKRIELPAKFIEHYSVQHDIVVDLFGGSGSTMAACEQLARRCYMMELDPQNCQIIINRMEKIYLKKLKKVSNILDSN